MRHRLGLSHSDNTPANEAQPIICAGTTEYGCSHVEITIILREAGSGVWGLAPRINKGIKLEPSIDHSL
jgi:hypothetical protein